MSSGGYDAVHPPAMYQRYEPRRASGNFPTPNHDRPFNRPMRRQSPSPGPSRRFSHDNYTPNQVEPTYRNEHPNSYRPGIYRPDYSTGPYFNRSPSPDRYAYPSRPQDAESWDRPNSWHPPVKNISGWQERKTGPPSPTRERPRRDDMTATRIFEPSDAWKRDHIDRPPRFDGPPVFDRYPNYRRDNADASPDRPSRFNRVPPTFPAGDRYRPQEPFRDPYYNTRPDYDSYRPYDDPWVPPVRDSISAPIHRREVTAPNHTRNLGHFEPYHGRQLSGSNSTHGSISPGIRIRSPIRRPHMFSQERSAHPVDQLNYGSDSTQRDRFADHGDTDSHRTKSLMSRPSSRSSIASTLHSEKRDASPRSTTPVMSQTQSNSGHDNLESVEPQRSSYAGNMSSSYRLPNLQSINDSKSLAPTEYPTHFHNETKESRITKEAEANEIISENRSRMDLRLGQTPFVGQSDTPRSLSPVLDHNSPSPFTPRSLVTRKLNATLLSSNRVKVNDAAGMETRTAPPLIPSTVREPSPLPSHSPTQDSDISKNQGGGVPVQDMQAGEAPLNINLERVSTPGKLSMGKDITPRTFSMPQLSKKISDNLASIPGVESDKRVMSKSAPTSPLSDRAAPSSPVGAPGTNEAKTSTKEALRVVVMTRLLCDRQTREERVNPVLIANLASAPPSDFGMNEEANAEAVIRNVMTGPHLNKLVRNFERLQPSLARYFSQRHSTTNGKTQHLRQEYIQLQEKWSAHCHALNEQAKPSILEGEAMPIGRTTRRSANLGDAVRSDLEMEQILASLESNDATDPNHLSQRNLATIPDMICVTNGKLDYVFDDTNHRVEDPAEYYAPCTGIHDWTEEEKSIFLDKYAAYPKQFGIIADSLPNKTSAQCVDYYYLHKKSLIDFRKVVSKLGPKRRRRGAGKRKGNALLTDIQRHDEEVHRDSGSPSILSSQTNRSARGRKPKEKDSSETKPEGEKRGPGRPPSKRIAAPLHVEKTPTATPTPEPEAKARRRRATAAAASSTGPPSRTVSLNLDEAEEDNHEPDSRPAKRAKRTRKVKSAAIVEEDPTTPELESTPLPDVSTPTLGKAPISLSIQVFEQDKSRWSSQSIISPS